MSSIVHALICVFLAFLASAFLFAFWYVFSAIVIGATSFFWWAVMRLFNKPTAAKEFDIFSDMGVPILSPIAIIGSILTPIIHAAFVTGDFKLSLLFAVIIAACLYCMKLMYRAPVLYI